MNKLLRKVMVLALAGTMTVGMNATVFAEDTQTPTTKETNSRLKNGGNNVASDTATINLIKDYVRGSGSDQESSSPAEDFVFTITPYGVWNAGSSSGLADGNAYDAGNMPALAVASGDNTVTVESDNKTNIVTIKAEVGDAGKNTKKSATITLSEYKSVGDFWYKVVETQTKTTGVFYGTNDAKGSSDITVSNGRHEAVYYIHVQVVNNPDYDTANNSKKFLRSVTMHKTAPTDELSNSQYNTWAENTTDNNYAASAKVNDIQNTYYAGKLSIKKEVTGNAGDKEKRFQVTVTFTKPAGTIITSDITYSAVFSEKGTSSSGQTIYGQNNVETSGWMTSKGGTSKVEANATDAAYARVSFFIKDGETVIFKNIPYGVSYQVVETEPSDNTYTNKLVFSSPDVATSFNGQSVIGDTGKVNSDASAKDKTGNFFVEEDKIAGDISADNAATGSISDASDELVITNNKDVKIDVGVITSNAPYIAMLLLVAAAAFVFVHRRKNMIEE
ncbi:DUF7601 domain-containing protein [Blautia sp. HCP3S3_H10_1]|uniref:DUF7601 domain-containing protein n=1 Tax=unclassified Blautia TaxID=2648079 RepID=UPI003F91CBCC